MEIKNKKVKEMYQEFLDFLEQCKKEDSIEKNLEEINNRWNTLGRAIMKSYESPWIIKMGSHEPIISREMYENANQVTRDNEIVKLIGRWLHEMIQFYQKSIPLTLIIDESMKSFMTEEKQISYDDVEEQIPLIKIVSYVLDELNIKLKLCQFKHENADVNTVEKYLTMTLNDAREEMRKSGIQLAERIRDDQPVSVDTEDGTLIWTIGIGDTYKDMLSVDKFTGIIH